MDQVKEPVKEEREHVLAIARRIMAGVSPVAANSQTQQPFPTPSPFSFSMTSTRWSSRPSMQYSNLILRFLVFLFSFISALTLATPSTRKKGQRSLSFTEYPELIYCFIIAILAFLYAAFQLFKVGGLHSRLIFCGNTNHSTDRAKHTTLERNHRIN